MICSCRMLNKPVNVMNIVVVCRVTLNTMDLQTPGSVDEGKSHLFVLQMT